MRATFVVILLLSTVLQAIPLAEAGTPASVIISSDSDSVSVDGAIQFSNQRSHKQLSHGGGEQRQKMP